MTSSGKVAIVTGATRGIGKACALSLAREGFDVVVTGRTQKEGEGTATMPFSREGRQVDVPGSLETTVKAVQALGRRALPVRMDVLDRSSMDAVVASLVTRPEARALAGTLVSSPGFFQARGITYP